jgi:zinc D-Ala-D-Ala carboxypeptidase
VRIGPQRRRVATALIVCGVVAMIGSSPALGAVASESRSPRSAEAPTPTSSTAPSPSPEPEEPRPLTDADLAEQIANARRVAAMIESSTSELAVATRRMDDLSARSNVLLERLARAREVEGAARATLSDAQRRLAAVEGKLARTREVLRAWVFSVYTGGSDIDISGMFEAMGVPADQAGDPLGDLSYLTEQRTRALDDVRTLTAEQARLTAAATRAAATATAARAVIERDKTALDTVIAAQRSRIGALRDLQIAEVDKATPIAGTLVGARTPKARAAIARLRQALSAAAVTSVGPVGKPCSNDTDVHPNGRFPDSALCPLWSAPGERLSPAAAAAFNALSQAYAAQTGTPLCVTDSYRSLLEQYAIKATRGRFAATPGTSRHGLGNALDLCGGIQDFGSAAHRWMKVNAPLYGWFHPSWAAADGSLPEPWHWEYGG